MAQPVWCLCGLGNPGPDYALHRHNLGAQLVEFLFESHGTPLSFQKKLGGRHAKITVDGAQIHGFIPDSYMNLSGGPTRTCLRFFDLQPTQLIVAHDELDIPVGELRVKTGGGSGGHNGLKDIDRHLGTPNYHRLRLGIGRPLPPQEVSAFVLKPPRSEELPLIQQLFDALYENQNWLWAGQWDKMKNHFHAPKKDA